jgi:hypothetical protein
VFVTIYWTVYTIALHLHLRRYPVDVASEGSSSWTIKILNTVGGLHHALAFLLAIARNPSFVRTLRVVRDPLGRLINLFTMTLPQFEQYADRVRQERYAKLLDFDGVARQSTRLSEELTCQIRMNEHFIFFTFMSFYLVYHIMAPSAGSSAAVVEIHRLSLWGAAGEIVGSVVLEIVWRYFRLDLES